MPSQLRASYQQIQSPVNSGRQPANLGTAYSPRTAGQGAVPKNVKRGVSNQIASDLVSHEGQILAYTQASKVMNSTQRFSPSHHAQEGSNSGSTQGVGKFYKSNNQDAPGVNHQLAYLNVSSPASKHQMQTQKRGHRNGGQQI